jgi:hypothetical protein
MGRKSAPQPLSLPESTAPGDRQRAGETLQIVSPADSRSPRSPRSPFSRFGAQKKTTPTHQPPLHVADLVQHSPADSAEGFVDDRRSPHAHPEQHSSRLTDIHDPHRQQQQQRPPKNPGQDRGHQRQNEAKASRSGFFHFGKSSKSTERLGSHQHTDSRQESAPRLSEQRQPVSKYSQHQPGQAPPPLPKHLIPGSGRRGGGDGLTSPLLDLPATDSFVPKQNRCMQISHSRNPPRPCRRNPIYR